MLAQQALARRGRRLAQRAKAFAFHVAFKPASLVSEFICYNHVFLDPIVCTLSWQRWPPAGCAAWQAASAQHERAATGPAAWVAFQEEMDEWCGNSNGSDSGGAQEMDELYAGADGYVCGLRRL